MSRLPTTEAEAGSRVEHVDGRPTRVAAEADAGGWDNSDAGVKRLAVRRLMHDLRDLEREPVPMVEARPVEDDLFEWHANMMGPIGSAFEAVCFHLIIAVPPRYPREAPRIEIQSYLSHPNVYSEWICLDMLEGQWCPDDPRNEKKTDVGYGWTPAYTMRTILINLQAFLFDFTDTAFWAKLSARAKRRVSWSVTYARTDAKGFVCEGCAHTGEEPWPAPLAWRDRLQYLIPSEERADIECCKEDLRSLIENIDSLAASNSWPVVSPIEPGALAPWWDEDYVARLRRGEAAGARAMPKKNVRLIRALVDAAVRWLETEGRGTPSKSLVCQWMHRIETACDLAMNGTKAGAARLRATDEAMAGKSVDELMQRSRGHWQWYDRSVLALTDDGLVRRGAGRRSGVPTGGEWVDLPPLIGEQIEALYCRSQAELRRAGELVRLKSLSEERRLGEYSNLAIVCEPREETRESAAGAYTRDGDSVRIMKVDPFRTTRAKCLPSWRGPDSNVGKTKHWYTLAADGTRKEWQRMMIIDKERDAKGELWLVLHPMPRRCDSWYGSATQVHRVSDLAAAAQGRAFKAYFRGSIDPACSAEHSGKHYVVELKARGDYSIRCVEDAEVFALKRQELRRPCIEIFRQVRDFAKRCSRGKGRAARSGQAEAATIEPLPLMDPKKHAKICSFVDIVSDDDSECTESDSEAKDDDEDEDEDDGSDVLHGKETVKEVMQRGIAALATSAGESGATEAEREQLLRRGDVASMSVVNRGGSVLFDDALAAPLEKGDRVRALDFVPRGRIVSVSRNEIELDIGLPRTATLRMSEMPMSDSAMDDLIVRWGIEEKRAVERAQKDREELAALGKTARRRLLKKRYAERAKSGADGAAGEGGDGKSRRKARVLPRSYRNTDGWFESLKREDRVMRADGGATAYAAADAGKRRKAKAPKSKKGAAEGASKSMKSRKAFFAADSHDDDDRKSAGSSDSAGDRSASKARVAGKESLIGAWIGPLWVVTPWKKIEVSMRRPLESMTSVRCATGRVRNVLRLGLSLDIGCSADAFVTAEALGAGLSEVVFDCRGKRRIGDRMQLAVSHAKVSHGHLRAGLAARGKRADRLTFPGIDFNESRAVRVAIFGLLPDELNARVFEFVDRATLHNCQKVCRLFERIIGDRASQRWELKELKCFHTRFGWDEDDSVVLGMGVDVERYPGSNTISGVTPRLDGFISNVSYFEYAVTRSAYKQPFGYWLPLYICPSHGARALPWMKRAMCAMMAGTTQGGEQRPSRKWKPLFVLKIIPALMNTMIVRVMDGDMHESIVALEGYTMMFHMLLAFCAEYAEVQAFVDAAIGKFIDNEKMRSKKNTPSLGEWIALLAASDKYCWRDACVPYLRECFDRHVKWILNSAKELTPTSGPKAVSQEQRIRTSFEHSQVSLKLCMFHVCFLRLFRFSQRSGAVMDVRTTKRMLDEYHGRPTHAMKRKLQAQVKRIKKLSNYAEFFHSVGVKKAPNDDELFEWLVTAVDNSARRGYHKTFWYPKKGSQ